MIDLADLAKLSDTDFRASEGNKVKRLRETNVVPITREANP
jgi:hypothetical protein